MKDVIQQEVIQIASWSSGGHPTGTDYYRLFKNTKQPEFFILNSYGNHAHWEYDDWEYFTCPKENPMLVQQLVGTELSNDAKCALIVAVDKKRFYPGWRI